MKCRVSIQWTETALNCMRRLPPKVRRGLFAKADELTEGDPRKIGKPLTGPLEDYYRIVYSRYRAVYSAKAEKIANGDVLVHVKVRFVAAGVRKEHDKNDIYRVAEKLIRMLPLDDDEEIEIKNKTDI